MEIHTAFVVGFKYRCSSKQISSLGDNCPRVLSGDSSADCRRSMVLRQSSRCTSKFRGSSVSYPASDFDLEHAAIDSRLGVRESSTIMAFAYAGLSQSNGLIVSILFGAIVGVVGGIIWIVSGLGFRVFNERRARPEPVPTTEIAPLKFQRNATLHSSR
jgi:hypothetical protein